MRGLPKDLTKAFFVSFLVATIISLLLGATVYQRIADYDIDVDRVAIDSSNTVVYDKHGNKMAEFERSSKEMTYYDEIPRVFVEAAVATEDRDFFDHAGVSPESLLRALIVNVRAGSFEQGGSTITQQLVKQIFLDPGKTIERKLREWILSTIVEERFSKRDIISYYLNHNFYGYRAYGIESALRTYYGQTFEEFMEDEPAEQAAKAAFLIGVPNAPSYFDPYENPTPTKQRRNSVLTNMYIEGYINQEVYNEAKDMGFLVLDTPRSGSENETIFYPEFVTYVLSEAAEEFESTIEDVMYGGFQIYTSFDPDIYEVLRKNIEQTGRYPTNPYASESIQGASVLINPQNGEIYAMTGAKDDTDEFLVLNRAFQSKRQPGSALKPIIAYGPALETGKFNMYSTVSCQNTYGDYTVRDYSCYGPMPMHEAVRWSRNATTVWTLNQIGINYAREYTQMLGIELSDNDVYLPIALGGMEYGVTPLELADAYQVYANRGMKADAHAIKRVVDSDNKVIYQPEEPQQLIDAENARQMKSMLQGVVSSGTGTSAQVSGYNVAGKTGTNEKEGGGGNSDLWFVGFTDQVVASVWMGYDNVTGSNFIPPGSTSGYPARMFQGIVSQVLPIINSNNSKNDYKEVDLNVYLSTERNQTQLEWDADSNVKYEVYKNGRIIGDSYSGIYVDNYINPGVEYTYHVVGYSELNGEKIVTSVEEKITIPE